MRLGLFGGTFDPPHTGHLVAAQDALTRLALDRVVFIPAGTPPHKQDWALTPVELRLAMLRAATALDERFDVDDIEARRDGPSYTVDTLRAYHERPPGDELFLILGADQYAELDGWREAADIRRLSRIVVMTRAGQSAGPLSGRTDAGRVDRVEVTRVDVSATEIRRRIASDEPIRYLVPAAVEEIIRQNRLYRTTAG